MEPASTIIKLCGGAAVVAKMTGRTLSIVHRWTYPPERGGTGGVIPAKCVRALLTQAPARGIDLRPEHFLPPMPVIDTAQPEGDAA